MVRKVKSKNLGSKEYRRSLSVASKPHYLAIGQGLHLGYRKGATARKPNGAGKWVCRLYRGDKDYEVVTIGTADDAVHAIDREVTIEDIERNVVMTFEQAQGLCWALKLDREAERTAPPVPAAYTVSRAIDDYMVHLEGRHQPTSDSRIRADRHIIPSLGEKRVDELTASTIREWLNRLSRSAPARRSKKDEPAEYVALDTDDEDVMRRRRATANRTLTILKAALNLAWRNDHVQTDSAWRKVEPFEAVDGARTRYLQIAECTRLINAAQGDFRDLVEAALQTGMRYGELARIKVVDINFDVGAIHVPKSKSGKQRDVVLTDEGAAFFKELCAGKAGDDVVLTHMVAGSRVPWEKNHQSRPMAEAVKAAKISPEIGFHGLRHTWASHAVMNGMPLMVVSQNLGHADTRMVEKHYGHLSPSYRADQIRQNAPTFGVTRGNVASIS